MSISFQEYQKRMQNAYKVFQSKLSKISIESALRMEASGKKNATTYPRVKTGRLRASIRGIVKQDDDRIKILVRAGGDNAVEYAEYIEYGTNRIQPRYFLRRAVRKEEKRVKPLLEKLMSSTLRGKK